MAKCGFCGKRKGKRPCPALGAICSECCGVHRQKEITCPSHCAYLPSTASRGAMNTATTKLDDFTMRHRGAPGERAADAWFAGVARGDRRTYEWEASSFLAYLEVGFADERGKRLIDLFLDERRADLTPAEHDAILAIRDKAWVTHAEIQSVRLDVGLELLDLVSGETVFVHEKRGTHGAREGDHLLVWIVPYESHHELPGGVTPVPPAHVGVVEAAIARAMDKEPRPDGTAARRERLREALPAIHDDLRHAVANWKPSACYPDGEEVTFCRAVYEVSDREKVEEKLRSSREVGVTEKGGFILVRRVDVPDDVPPLEAFGEVELRTVRLTVMTLSRSRHEEGKKVIARVLRGLVRHRVDSIQEMADVVRGAPPPEVAALPAAQPLRLLPAVDVDTAIDGFNKDVGMQIGAWAATRPASPPPESAASLAPPSEGKRTHHLPPTAHEVMRRIIPDLANVVADVVREVRARPGFTEALTVSQQELEKSKPFMNLLYTHAHSCVAKGWTEEDAAEDANYLATHAWSYVNFDLHGRKTFWVDEALAFMLAQTDLDIVGRALRLPFPSCAFVLTDRASLELGESLLSQETTCGIRGQQLQIITVHATRDAHPGDEDPMGLSVSFFFDARGERWPYLVSRELFIKPEDHLDTILDSRHPSIAGSRDPLFLAPELKKLVHIVVNAILYTTSAHLAPIILQSPAKLRPLTKKQRKLARKGEAILRRYSSEDVFYLPGHIDISRLRRLQSLARNDPGGTLMTRFMVRGHWRRANPTWEDRRLRWIEPYWKGPDLATVIEREYRLKP